MPLGFESSGSTIRYRNGFPLLSNLARGGTISLGMPFSEATFYR